MTLRFVKTSILSSEDGIDFSKEENLETEEAKKARIEMERASKKPLYEQLAEQRERKQEEYDENTKKIFAPPKALDEEDISYFEDLNERERNEKSMRFAKEQEELERFREAQKIDHQELHQPKIKFQRERKEYESNLKTISVVKKRRKINSVSETSNVSKNSNSTELNQQNIPKIESDNENNAKPQEEKEDEEKNLMGLLGGYGSDEEES